MEGARMGSSADDATHLGDEYNDSMKIMGLVRAYMNYGHLSSSVDPLELDTAFAEQNLGKKYGNTAQSGKLLLDFKHWGLSEADLDKSFYIDVPQLGGLL